MTEQNAVLSSDATASVPPQSTTVATGDLITESGSVYEFKKSVVGGKTCVTIKTYNTALKLISVREVSSGQTPCGYYYSAGTATVLLTKSDINDRLVPALVTNVVTAVTYKTGINPTVSPNATRFRFNEEFFELTIPA